MNDTSLNQMSLPATQAVIRFVTIPPNKAVPTNFARSLIRLGAIGPRPPSCMPMELILANPQRA